MAAVSTDDLMPPHRMVSHNPGITIMPIGTTITEFIIEEQRQMKGVSGDFTALINDVVIACKAISSAVRYGSLVGVLGTADTDNIQGETQKKLDVISNNLFIKRNEWAGHVAALASEEMNDVYHLPTQYPRGKYLLIFDPLDGSSNTDVCGAVGTIFSILRRPEGSTGEPTEDDFCNRAPAGLRRLRALRSVLDDGVDHRPRGQRLHPGPAHRRVHPDPPQHENSRGYPGILDQRFLHAVLGSPGAPLHRRMSGRQGRPAPQGFQHALGRRHDRRRPSDPLPRAASSCIRSIARSAPRTRKASCA